MRPAESEWVPTDSRVKSPTLPQNLSPVLKVWVFLASIVTLQGFIFYTSPLDTRVLANDEPKVATTQHTFSLAPPPCNPTVFWLTAPHKKKTAQNWPKFHPLSDTVFNFGRVYHVYHVQIQYIHAQCCNSEYVTETRKGKSIFYYKPLLKCESKSNHALYLCVCVSW